MTRTCQLLDKVDTAINRKYQTLELIPFLIKVTVTFTSSRTETTTWEEHFGIMASLSYSSGLIVNLVANIEFQLTTTYDYLTGGSSEVTSGVEYSETVIVNAEPHMTTTVNLVVMRQDDAVIPFYALVRYLSLELITLNENSKKIRFIL